MGAGFTPGPWENYRAYTAYYNGPEEAGDPCFVTAPNDGVILAVVVPDAVPQVDANARLIAAAPELFETLAAVLADYEALDDMQWREKAKHALAKARGEA